MKFQKEISEVSSHLTELGIINTFPTPKKPEHNENFQDFANRLFNEHFEKIKNADALLVVNPGGYIGSSVKIEIGYAKALGKKIIFLDKANEPEIQALADEIKPLEEFTPPH
jgi:nucleoside 2-deoxyribosyltransferase